MADASHHVATNSSPDERTKWRPVKWCRGCRRCTRSGAGTKTRGDGDAVHRQSGSRALHRLAVNRSSGRAGFKLCTDRLTFHRWLAEPEDCSLSISQDPAVGPSGTVPISYYYPYSGKTGPGGITGRLVDLGKYDAGLVHAGVLGRCDGRDRACASASVHLHAGFRTAADWRLRAWPGLAGRTRRCGRLCKRRAVGDQSGVPDVRRRSVAGREKGWRSRGDLRLDGDVGRPGRQPVQSDHHGVPERRRSAEAR